MQSSLDSVDPGPGKREILDVCVGGGWGLKSDAVYFGNLLLSHD